METDNGSSFAAPHLAALLQAFGADYYVSPEAAREALGRRSMFNVIDFGTGVKADFILRKDRPFSREEFGGEWATVAGCDVRDRVLARDLTHKTYAPRDTPWA